MKTFFLVVVYVACVAAVTIEYTTEERDAYRKLRKECIEETKVDATIIENIDKLIYPADYKDTKCYYKCLFNKFGHWDANAEFVYNKIKEGPMKELMDKCMKETADDLCERTYKIHKCYKENSKA